MASEIKVDTVSEKTSGSGVTIDGLLIKDGGISGDVSLIGTTPTFTIGDAGAEDAALVFDGNAQDFYIALDDSADDLLIGLGSTVGTTAAVSIDENLQVKIVATTASTSATTGSLIAAGGAGIAADLHVGDDVTLISDSAVLGFGADKDTTLTHTDGTGLTLNSTNKLCFNDASQFVQGSSATVLSIGATDEIDLTATAIDINGTCDISGTFSLAGTNVTATAAELNIVDGGTSATSTTLADADRVVVNDNGTMVQVAMSDVKTYIGAANTPSFYAALASDQTINASTYTKLLLATESWDTNSAFASNKFTVPTGEGGKYHIGFSIGTASVMDNVERVIGKLYVNGGAQNHTTTHMWAPGDNVDLFINFSTILNLDADEYVELYGYQTDASAQNMVSTYTRMWGFKLIGV